MKARRRRRPTPPRCSKPRGRSQLQLLPTKPTHVPPPLDLAAVLCFPLRSSPRISANHRQLVLADKPSPSFPSEVATAFTSAALSALCLQGLVFTTRPLRILRETIGFNRGLRQHLSPSGSRQPSVSGSINMMNDSSFIFVDAEFASPHTSARGRTSPRPVGR